MLPVGDVTCAWAAAVRMRLANDTAAETRADFICSRYPWAQSPAPPPECQAPDPRRKALSVQRPAPPPRALRRGSSSIGMLEGDPHASLNDPAAHSALRRVEITVLLKDGVRFQVVG